MQTQEDRRRALDELAARLKSGVFDVIKSAWSSQLNGAAKSVTDVWPDKLALATTALQRAFAAYRPNVEVAVPVTPRDAFVKAVDDAANKLASDLAATVEALIGAKQFKTEGEKATIDKSRDALDRASVALQGWIGDFHLFDDNVESSSGPPPPAKGQTFVTFGNANPYAMTLSAMIADERDWGSTTDRPDKALKNVTIGGFGQVRARLDVASGAASAKYRVEATLKLDPPVKLAFTCDQTILRGPPVSYQPVPIEGGSQLFVVFQSSQDADGVPELVVVVGEQRGA